MGSELNVRRAVEDDVDEFLALRESQFGQNGVTEDWFYWKYHSLSELENTPVVIAESRDRVVGAIGYLGLRFEADGVSLLGIQPVDVGIHPDHRGMNTFNRLVEAGRERVYPDENWFEFGWPNDATVDVWTRLQNWERVCGQPRYFRIQNPAKYLVTDPSTFADRIVSLGDFPFRTLLSVRDRVKIGARNGYDVTRHEEVPVAALGELYRKAIPDEFHAVRDERFYETRLNAPHNSYVTYVTRQNGRPTAAVIVSVREEKSYIHLVDVLPIGSDDEETVVAKRAALNEVVLDYRASSGIDWTPALPVEFLAEFDFDMPDTVSRVADSALFPSKLAQAVPEFGSKNFCVRSAGSESVPDGITEAENWWISFIEKDVV